jgi:hypothetical protein
MIHPGPFFLHFYLIRVSPVFIHLHPGRYLCDRIVVKARGDML